MRPFKFVWLIVCVLVMLPASGYAQATLAGVVKDSSGSVLPGVMVEASSDALIEKVRTAVTDGTGQYQMVDLRPGIYTVVFTLSGFSTVKHEGIEIASRAGGTTINADLPVGPVEAVVTVSAQAPVVDVQSTRRLAVLDGAVVAALPATRDYGSVLAAVPGIQMTGLGSIVSPTMTFFTAHGGRGNEGTVQIDGMNVGSTFNGGGVTLFGYDTASASEIQVTVVGGMGEVDRGGPAFNIIPKTGGNSFRGTVFGSAAGKWSQGSNLDDRLRSFNITEPPALINNWDTSFALGGPLQRDRLWFYGIVRDFANVTAVANAYGNKNAGNPSQWFYERDPDLPVRSTRDRYATAIRLTGQPSRRDKVGFSWERQRECIGSSYSRNGDQCRQRGDNWIALGGSFSSPEAASNTDDPSKIIQATWTSTPTNRLLFEAGLSRFEDQFGSAPAGALLDFIPVTELSVGGGVPLAGYTYRGLGSYSRFTSRNNQWRASMSYVTGAHRAKVGYAGGLLSFNSETHAGTSGLAYTFFNRTPISLTQRIDNQQSRSVTRYDAFYGQDQWTAGRLTLQGALRYEYATSYFPEDVNGILGTSPFNVTPLIYPRIQGVSGFHDLTPRMGAAYDLFGNGKTSLKASFSKYLESANNSGAFSTGNPAATIATTTSRSWSDLDHDFVPDCDLNNPGRQVGVDICGPWMNQNFGKTVSATVVNPATLKGWGKRPYDWQTFVGLQQEILPRVSAEVSYNRRSWGNFYVTDNRAVGPENFDKVTLTAPANGDLPGGGGYPVSFYVIKDVPNGFGLVDNYFTSASDYGNVTYYWHGVDVEIKARMQKGLVFQGGTTTGRGVRDTCQVTAKLPELLRDALGVAQQIDSCAVNEVWQTTFRGLASYIIPKADVQVSAIIRSQPNAQPGFTSADVATNGTSLAATYTATSAQVQQILGRPLPGGAATQNVNLLLPGQLYGPRVNSTDLRFTKVLNIRRSRTNVGIDLLNLFNANTGTVFNQTFGTTGTGWLTPTTILNPRFVRFNVTVDF